MRSPATLLALVGPSGAGKTTLARALQSAGIERIATTTTRPLRPGEVPGRDLHLVSAQTFARLRTSNAVIATCDYSRASYGVQLTHLVAAAAVALPHVIIVEPSGVEALRSWAAECGVRFAAVFVTATPELITGRLNSRYAGDLARGPERDDRLARAIDEATAWRNAYAWDLILESGSTAQDVEAVLEFLTRPSEPTHSFAACA